MPEQNVNVPAVGKVKRIYVIGGLAAVAGIVVYAYWRRSQMPEEVAAGEGDQFVPEDWSPDAYVGATAPGGETYDPAITDGGVTTNAEWSQRVVDLLEGVGYDRNKAAATVGKYLSGQPLDATEKLIIQTAIALLGNPPAGALPIISAPTPTTPTPTSTPTPGTAKGKIIGAHGTQLTANTTLISLARRYAAAPHMGDSVEGTKRWILARNPWLIVRRLNHNNSVLKKGWVIVVPTRAK